MNFMSLNYIQKLIQGKFLPKIIFLHYGLVDFTQKVKFELHVVT